MDYIIYSDKLHATSLPTVVASTSSPKTAYHPGTDIVFVNTGSGWSPMLQPGSASIYSAYSGAAASTQANMLTSVASTASEPTAIHAAVAKKVTEIAVRGR